MFTKNSFVNLIIFLGILMMIFGCADLEENEKSPSTGQPPTAETVNSKIVGAWTRSSSSLWGTSPGEVSTNAGYYKCRYIFSKNGTYSFKGESWGGYLRSEEFWTIEENGTFAVSGDSVTVSPQTSRATLRNRDGSVKESQNNQLERVTYKWKTHYFEGIHETNLVLQTSLPTRRDGAFSSNNSFPNAYLYSQGDRLEWRF